MPFNYFRTNHDGTAPYPSDCCSPIGSAGRFKQNASTAVYPQCRLLSRRVHSRYDRRLDDLTFGGLRALDGVSFSGPSGRIYGLVPKMTVTDNVLIGAHHRCRDGFFSLILQPALSPREEWRAASWAAALYVWG